MPHPETHRCYLVGTTFVQIHEDAEPSDLLQYLIGLFGQELGSAAYELYNPTKFNATDSASSAWWALSAMLTDADMACPARRSARWLSNLGLDVYLYQFTHQWILTYLVPKPLGVFHGSELPFVFDYDLLLIGDEFNLAVTMVCYWSSFAKTGDPNSDFGCPNTNQKHLAWPRYNVSTDMNLEFTIGALSLHSGLKVLFCQPLSTAFCASSTVVVSLTQSLQSSVCDFWDSVYDSGCIISQCPCNCSFPIDV